MGVLTSAISALGGDLVGKIGDVIGDLHTSEKEKLDIALAESQLKLAARESTQAFEAELETLFVQADKEHQKTIRAQLASDDWFVRRMRPAVGWVCLLIIVYNYIVLTTAQMIFGMALVPLELPTELWVMFGSLIGGYSVMRTMEKGAIGKRGPTA